MADLPSWPRPHFTKPGSQAHFFYVAFIDQAPADWAISGSAYRCSGIPDGIDVIVYGPESHPEVVGSFREGPIWDQLVQSSPELTAVVKAAPCCVLLRGSVPDNDTLDDHRNLVGMLQWLCDKGAFAILDLTAITWWSPEEWRAKAFDPAAPSPNAHVVILNSETAHDTHWLHTRGMIKYGRPDISVRGVRSASVSDAARLINRFIELMALGGLVPEGASIRVDGMPEGMVARHAGSMDDPDFNNVHITIDWAT